MKEKFYKFIFIFRGRYDVKLLYSFHNYCGLIISHAFYMNVDVAALPVLLVVSYASITLFLLCKLCICT